MAFWDDILNSLSLAKDQALHPVYNQLGRQIGWFETDQKLAAQQIHQLPGEAAGPPEQWLVKSPLGVTVPADVYLINQGLQPSWLAPGGPISQAIAQDTGANPANPGGLPDPFGFVSDFQLPAIPGLGGALDMATLALVGAALLLGVAVLRRV